MIRYLAKTGLKIVILIIIWVSLQSCEPTNSEELKPIKLKHVSVSAIEAGWQTQTIFFPGVVRAVDRSALAFQIDGILAARFVKLGQIVNKGDPLATLDNPRLDPAVNQFTARIKELDTQIAQLQRDLNRLTALAARQLVSDDQIEQIRSQFDGAVANRAVVLAQLADATALRREATLFAPFNGVIAETPVGLGEFTRAGAHIMTINSVSKLEVELELPGNVIAALRPGQSIALVFPDFPSHQSQGQIRELGLVGRQPGGLFPVVVDFDPQAAFRPGIRVKAKIPIPMQFPYAIDVSAVSDPGIGRPRIFLVEQERVKSVEVQLGKMRDGKVSFRADVSIGDQAIIAGHGALMDGQQVKILR